MSDPLEVAAELARIFEDSGVSYVLGGSLASTAFGEPRATLDVDLAADLRPEHVVGFVRAVQDAFFVDAAWVREEVARHGSFQLVHRETMIRVDIFVPEWTGLHLWKWQRRCRLRLPGREDRGIDVTSPEGIVLQKLSWYRDGGEVSDRQWRDVVGVLKAQGDGLGRPELEAWAQTLGLTSLLRRALDQAGLA